MIKRLLPTVIIVAALASTAYMLILLDQMVYSTLYSYGLQFSYDWANPYWTLLRIAWIFLAICAVGSTANAILIVRSGSKEEQRTVSIAPAQKALRNIPVITQTEQRTRTASIEPSTQPPPPRLTPKPTPTTAPAPSYASPDSPALFKCTHCGKTFTQPLRMLNFQVDPPRIVNVCPFCNETMPSGSTVKESKQAENGTPLRERNDRAQTFLTR